mmetsp:Transcript_32539/g.50655  ORF Transcript_32539/g.50655 Transcript_32539/m.50655 type:complete len:612 (+) Transcript_32539:170-2005(+)
MSKRAKGRRALKAQGSEEQDNLLGEFAGSRWNERQACIVLVFESDEQEKQGKIKESMAEITRQPLIDKLRAADLIVRETCSEKNTKETFVLVSASIQRQQQVAEIMGQQGLLKVRLRQQNRRGDVEKNEGAWCEFKQHMKPLYEESGEGTLFSSLQQIRILEYILDDQHELANGPQLVQAQEKRAGCSSLDMLIEQEKLIKYFRLHHQGARDRLLDKWGWFKNWYKRQPIEDIREYFGEKIALYFAFLGYYTTMLWIPAACGVVLTFTQIYSHLETGSMDNPWVPLYCCFITIWAIVFLSGWKRLEMTYQHEWETLEYEEQEEDRKEFIQSKHTLKELAPYTNEIVRYPEPNHRRTAILISCVVVGCFIGAVVAVVSGVALLKFRIIQSLEPYGFSPIGKGCGATMQAISILVFNRVYQVVLKFLTDNENWKTATQYEDATIAKDFCFKLVNAYFACFFVAFVQNNFKIYGVEIHCPEWHCMPELTMTLAAVFTIQITIAQAFEIGGPFFRAWNRKKTKESSSLAGGDTARGSKKNDLGESGGEPAFQQNPDTVHVWLAPADESQEEWESELDKYSGVFDDYSEMIVQFGYVAPPNFEWCSACVARPESRS